MPTWFLKLIDGLMFNALTPNSLDERGSGEAGYS
jgi:hypothetical protein